MKSSSFTLLTLFQISFVYQPCLSGIYFILLLSLKLTKFQELKSDSDNIPLKTYEQLDYENFEFTPDSKRFKRDTHLIDNLYAAPNRLQFRAFGKKFNLILKKDIKIAAENLNIELRYSNKPSEYLKDSFSSNYFRGKVENESYSEVTVYFEEQKKYNYSDQPLIFAHIRIFNMTKETNYYIEPFMTTDEANLKLKFLIYRSEDIHSNVLSNGVFK